MGCVPSNTREIYNNTKPTSSGSRSRHAEKPWTTSIFLQDVGHVWQRPLLLRVGYRVARTLFSNERTTWALLYRWRKFMRVQKDLLPPPPQTIVWLSGGDWFESTSAAIVGNPRSAFVSTFRIFGPCTMTVRSARTKGTTDTRTQIELESELRRWGLSGECRGMRERKLGSRVSVCVLRDRSRWGRGRTAFSLLSFIVIYRFFGLGPPRTTMKVIPKVKLSTRSTQAGSNLSGLVRAPAWCVGRSPIRR